MFIDKLNKKQDGSVYVIEEEQVITSGKYEGYLQHDNANRSTLKVYTGSKLTGNEVINVVSSVPAETPWKTYIKVFTNVEKVYITYETPGDTVESEDINLLQETAEVMREDFEQYRTENDAAVSSLDGRMTVVESTKAAKTYVDAELAKKADKTNTYTKTETDQRIQNVVAAAPGALDTLKEIADALNNDPDFAATMTTQLSGKVDKVTGKGLSTEDYTTAEKTKLAGIETGANKYIHPSTHPPAIITQDTANRFVTDAEKSTWNGKASTAVATSSANGLMSSTDKSKLDEVENNANNYTHPNSGVTVGTYKSLTVNAQGHVTGGTNPTNLAGYGITDATPLSHVGSTGVAHGVATSSVNGFMSSTDKTKLDGVEAGANNYVHPGTGTNPHGTTKSDVGLGNVTNDAQVKRTEMGASSGVATLDSSGVNAQAPKAHTHDDRYYTESEANTKFATKQEVGQAGYGDMFKSIYDTDNDGIVDNAETVNGHTVESDVPANAKFTDTVYSHPTGSGYNHIPTGGVSGQILRWSASGTAAWGTDNNTTYSLVSTSTSGLMSADDKVKLNNITADAAKFMQVFTGGKYYSGNIGGSQDKGWKKLFRMTGSDRSGSGAATSSSTAYDAGTIAGKLYNLNGNYNQGIITKYNFQFTLHAWSSTSRIDAASLYIPYGTPDIIRVVKYGINDYELQIRTDSDWKNIGFEFWEIGNASLYTYAYQNLAADSGSGYTVVRDHTSYNNVARLPLTWGQLKGV